MRLPRYVLPGAFVAIAGACAVSTQQELTLGQQYSTQLATELPIVHDAAIQRDLDTIGARLTRYSLRPEVHYQFFLVNSDVVNAFAVPGGYIYVTREIVEHMTSMDQLAGVLGHEMGHVEHRHSAKQIGRQQAAEAGVALSGVLVGGQTGQVVQQASGVTAQLVLQRYSRDQEREADRFGVSVTTQAGINPNGLVTFFQVLKQVEGTEPDAVSYFFSSHPLTEDRIHDVSALIAATPAAQAATQTGRHDDPVFQRFKARVHQLPPPPRPPAQQGH